MKIFFNVILSWILIGFLTTHAAENTQNITRSDVFIFFASELGDEVPKSSEYINLKYTDISESSSLGQALQRLVYLDLIQNTNSGVFPNKNIDLLSLEKLTKILTDENISLAGDNISKQNTLAEASHLLAIQKRLNEAEQPTIQINSSFNINTGASKQDIFEDAYNTLNESHYDRSEFSEDQLIEGAIKGLANGTNDTYTSYFPPAESTEFFQSLDGEFEGIGAYIDMTEAGVLLIVSPIVDSPAESSGIKGGDRVTHVDGREILPENSQQEVISWIKGPAGTLVELTILRDGETFIIPVTRAKIILKDVEHELLERDTYYIQIKNFGERVEKEFEEALETINEDSNIQKIIIDLRNNPGGYLDEVSKLLSHLIDDDEPVAIVSTGAKQSYYRSRGYGTLDLNNYTVILLQNGGTASASEIMIGTLKDYFPEITIIGEQSFGKGSVQSLKTYYDGSTLKYTIAKWYTGKTETAIDGVGITPDIMLEFDSELYQNTQRDNQLERAKEY